MKLYHLTGRDNVESIMRDGFIPKIGENSKKVNESKAYVYFCQKKDIPYWKIMLKRNVILSVELDEEAIRRFDTWEYGDGRLEYLADCPVHSNTIKEEKVYVSKNRLIQIKKEIAICDIAGLNRLYSLSARLLDENSYNYLNEELLDEVNFSARAMTETIIQNQSLDVLSNKEKNEFLKECGENGGYTLYDAYYTVYKSHLYQIMPELAKKAGYDELYELLIELRSCISKTFRFGNLDTGGWCL